MIGFGYTLNPVIRLRVSGSIVPLPLTIEPSFGEGLTERSSALSSPAALLMILIGVEVHPWIVLTLNRNVKALLIDSSTPGFILSSCPAHITFPSSTEMKLVHLAAVGPTSTEMNSKMLVSNSKPNCAAPILFPNVNIVTGMSM